MVDQSVIRKKIQAARAALSDAQQAQYSLSMCQQIIDSGVLESATHIAFYLPVRGEADPTYLQSVKTLSNKQFYLPILSSSSNGYLAFAHYTKHTQMTLNRFNIPEPDVNQNDLLTDPRKLDAVIMPMVAIDRFGNRIGMGGGFYDRTFAFRKEEKGNPQLIAFAYDLQIIEPQIPQPWDVPADVIASQSDFINLSNDSK